MKRRHEEIITLLRQGLKNQEIAAKFMITRQAVEYVCKKYVDIIYPPDMQGGNPSNDELTNERSRND